MAKGKANEIEKSIVQAYLEANCRGAANATAQDRYCDAPDVRMVAERLIHGAGADAPEVEIFKHLKVASLLYLFDMSELSKAELAGKKRVVLAHVKKCSALDKAVTGCDFILVVRHEAWKGVTIQGGQEGLVFHELQQASPRVTARRGDGREI